MKKLRIEFYTKYLTDYLDNIVNESSYNDGKVNINIRIISKILDEQIIDDITIKGVIGKIKNKKYWPKTDQYVCTYYQVFGENGKVNNSQPYGSCVITSNGEIMSIDSIDKYGNIGNFVKLNNGGQFDIYGYYLI